MDYTIIASAIVTTLTPYLSKTGEKIAEKIGEELFPKIKSIFISNDEDKKVLEKLELQPTVQNITTFENDLAVKIENNPDIARSLSEILKLTPTKSNKIENILTSSKELKEDLKYLYSEYNQAGESTQGDYKNRITLQERKLSKLEKEFFLTIKI